MTYRGKPTGSPVTATARPSPALGGAHHSWGLLGGRSRWRQKARRGVCLQHDVSPRGRRGRKKKARKNRTGLKTKQSEQIFSFWAALNGLLFLLCVLCERDCSQTALGPTA
jgi:hypothetical protein